MYFCRFSTSNRASQMKFCPQCLNCNASRSFSEQCHDVSDGELSGDVIEASDDLQYKVTLRDVGSWMKVSYKFRIPILEEMVMN